MAVLDDINGRKHPTSARDGAILSRAELPVTTDLPGDGRDRLLRRDKVGPRKICQSSPNTVGPATFFASSMTSS
jgi:hypothetical protein